MIRHAPLLLLSALLGTLFLIPLTAWATEATPAVSGTSGAWTGTPPPVDCVIEPTTVDAVIEAVQTPVPAEDLQTFPEIVAGIAELPAGEPVGSEILDAASRTLWTAVACLNGGDYPRFFANFTAAGASGLIAGFLETVGREADSLTADEVAGLRGTIGTAFANTPVAMLESTRFRIDAIRGARLLPDGRMLLVVDGTLGVYSSVYLVLREIDGRWLVEAIGQIGNPAATPTA